MKCPTMESETETMHEGLRDVWLEAARYENEKGEVVGSMVDLN